MERLKCLDLFSGIGGNTLGLLGYIDTISYCEQDKHTIAVLLSRMKDGFLPNVPIFDDITTLKGKDLPIQPDIIVAGFPCQDISVAGKGVGIQEGTRSGLFYQIMRLTDEIQPRFLFLENVPAIRTRGLDIVLQELTQRGYDCRWTMLSAAQVGAKHKRQRWFLLADCNSTRRQWQGQTQPKEWRNNPKFIRASEDVANTEYLGQIQHKYEKQSRQEQGISTADRTTKSDLGRMVDGISLNVDESLPRYLTTDYWEEEPEGIPRTTEEKDQRVERIKRLGNGVVPLQARVAFEKLMFPLTGDGEILR